MYTVKQAAALTGVSEATLRVWERRYRLVTPARTASGYRLYDDAQVHLLREMAALVAAGVPASRAASAVVVSGLSDASSSLDPSNAGEAGDDLVGATAGLDLLRLDAVIAHAFARAPFEQVADDWLLPQLVRLGDAWQCGELTIAQEHVVSAALMRAIGRVYEAAPTQAPAAPVLVGLPAGARHELALFCFATCLRRLGVGVVYLGSDTPADAWGAAVVSLRARVAVIGVTSPGEAGPAQEVIDRLASIHPSVSIWIGGSARGSVSGATALPDRVSDAAGVLSRSLLAGRV